MNIRNYFTALHSADSNDGAAQQQNTQQVLLTRVLGDAFHVMDRIKVPMHHDFKPSFFRAIRAAIFVLNPEDVRQLKAALRVTSNKQWDKLLAFNFKFVAQRVQRRIPEPDMLYERLKAVFDYLLCR